MMMQNISYFMFMQVELCVKILSDILDLTFRKNIGNTVQDVKEIMLTALRTIIQTVISMDRENPLVGNLVSVMLAIFRQKIGIKIFLKKYARNLSVQYISDK